MIDSVMYGAVTSAKDAYISDIGMQPQDSGDQTITQTGNALWEYKHENKINGIPVAEEYKNLKIDRDDLLYAAFYLDSVPKSEIFWFSPDDADAIEKYNDILQRAYNGSIIIQEELKQYDTTKCKYLVWVKYNEVRYMLHKRFNYILEE